MMNSNKFRHLITIQTPTLSTTDDGKPIETWSTFAEVWANVKQITSKEELRGQQEIARGNYIVSFRTYPGVRETMQIAWGSKTLAINSVVEDEEERLIEIEASEVK